LVTNLSAPEHSGAHRGTSIVRPALPPSTASAGSRAARRSRVSRVRGGPAGRGARADAV